MSTRMIEGPDCPLHTRLDGPPQAPWIVLSHSLGADMSMWDPQIPWLTRHYRVLRYDTRGHGRSGTPADTWGFAEFVADVIAVMDAHDVERADFMGLSLGAMTGLGLALDHPGRLGRLVCADGRSDAPEGFRANWDNRIERVSEGGLEAIVDGTLENWFTPQWRDRHPEAVEKVRGMILSTAPAGYIGCCAALKTLDYFKDLGRIDAEVLYLCGEHDKGAPPEVMRTMAEATPRGRFEVVPDAAHLSNMNNPDAFNAALERFLLARPTA